MTNYEKYRNDPISFVKDMSVLVIPDKNVNNLKLQEYQIDIINSLCSNDFNAICKSRQMYISVTLSLFLVWRIFFKSNYRVGILSPSLNTSNRILEFIKIVINNLDRDFMVVNNKNNLTLSNGSSVKCCTSSVSSVKGYTFDFFYVDESDFVKKFRDIFECILISSKRMCLASTPKTSEGLFYDICTGNEGSWVIHNLDWTMNSNHTKNSKIIEGKLTSPWFEAMCNTLGNRKDYIERELYGRFCKRIDRNVYTKNKNKRINLRIDQDLYNKMFEKSGGKVSEYIRDLVKKDLK